jgi:presenilin-like A22 family membrane protease
LLVFSAASNRLADDYLIGLTGCHITSGLMGLFGLEFNIFNIIILLFYFRIGRGLQHFYDQRIDEYKFTASAVTLTGI